MFGIQNYASFIAAIIVFQLIPGPGTIAILDASARSGTRAGFATVAGTLLGDLVYMLAAVAGLAAVMAANQLLFDALQWCGAAYLCWIGIQLARGARDAAPSPGILRPARAHLRRGFAISLTNPKVVLFFVAFFPLFLRPDSSVLTLAALMVHVSLISLLYQGGLVMVGNALAARFRRSPAARRIALRLASFALIGFGVKLALSNR